MLLEYDLLKQRIEESTALVNNEKKEVMRLLRTFGHTGLRVFIAKIACLYDLRCTSENREEDL